MGQKVCPIALRLALQKRKLWRSQWYASKYEFSQFLQEDSEIRKFLMAKQCCYGTSQIMISRLSEKIQVTIRTARPGLVIGKKGSEIDILKEELRKLTGKDVWLEVEEIRRPDLDARLIAEGIAKQLERRVSFRRAMKKAIQAAMDAGADGIKIKVSGRLGGAEIARSEEYKKGRIPLHTLRADIDFARARAETTFGTIGIKVWVNLPIEDEHVVSGG